MNIGRFELNKIYNEDCYKAIKDIPDNSIDLVYIDPPYQFTKGGHGTGQFADRCERHRASICSVDTELTYKELGSGYISGGGCFGTKHRSYHSELNPTDVDKTKALFVSKGFTNNILDEFCRVLKHIYIYIYGVVKIN